MLLIAFGVVVCALGEANLVIKGLVQQLVALVFEVGGVAGRECLGRPSMHPPLWVGAATACACCSKGAAGLGCGRWYADAIATSRCPALAALPGHTAPMAAPCLVPRRRLG